MASQGPWQSAVQVEQDLVISRALVELSRWFTGRADIRTFELAELLGTKLRALYQRRKGRDLLDLALALREGRADPGRVVAAFKRHMKAEGLPVSGKEFERNPAEKLVHLDFAADVAPLLGGAARWDAGSDADEVRTSLLGRLRGWGSGLSPELVAGAALRLWEDRLRLRPPPPCSTIPSSP